MFQSIIKDRRGATMVEYAIMLGFIALICIAAAKVFGTTLKSTIDKQGKTVGGIATG
jgi:Flp pilus assembly pilin Flp